MLREQRMFTHLHTYLFFSCFANKECLEFFTLTYFFLYKVLNGHLRFSHLPIFSLRTKYFIHHIFKISLHFSFPFQAKDILALHEAKCPNASRYRQTQISSDGVSECRSNSNSMDVFSLRFQNCKTVYPHTIVRPLNKYKVKGKPYLEKFIKDVDENDCVIKAFVGDSLKRSDVRDSLGHSSSFACEYCFTKATSIEISNSEVEKKKELKDQKKIIIDRIEKLQSEEDIDEEQIMTLQLILDRLTDTLKNVSKTRKQLVWPSSSLNGEPRTKDKILAIIQNIEQDENSTMTKDEKKGIVGRSPLLNLDYFDYVLCVTAEYMHSMCIGVIKRLIELTFNVGIQRKRNTKRKLSPPSLFNDLMSKIKVVGDFSRRVRALDFAVLKAQEFRNIAIIFFPIVIECIEPSAEERKLWLYISYVMRACVLPTKEYQQINDNLVKELSEKFYKLYEKLFSAKNCSYNTHVVGGHLPEIRALGPLTLTSAFGFEHFYGEMRQSFAPSTISPLKQIMTKVLMKRALGHHSCQSSIKLSNKDTERECNSLIYTYIHKVYKFYQIVDFNEDEKLLNCKEILKSEYFFEETPNLDWAKVGLFQEEELQDQIVKIEKIFVAGKLIRVNNLLITCPNNVLLEK